MGSKCCRGHTTRFEWKIVNRHNFPTLTNIYNPSKFYCIFNFLKVSQIIIHVLYFWFLKIEKTAPHCSVSSNSFHGQITQKGVHQISDPENKKCSRWKFFGTNHPQNLRFLSRRGPRSLDMRLSQHYIGPKMTFRHFPNFCRKKFPGLTKEFFCTYWMIDTTWFLQITTPKVG